MKKIIVSILVVCLLLTATPINVGGNEAGGGGESVEYWALIVCCDQWYDFEPYREMGDSIEAALIDAGWKEAHIYKLYQEEAYSWDVVDNIRLLAKKVNPQDTLLIFLAGHGHIGYFCTYCTELEYNKLNFELNKIDCSAMGVWISACYSGSTIPHLQQDGRVIVTASRDNETSGGFSLTPTALDGFADYVVNGVGGNNDGVVSVEEAFKFQLRRLMVYDPWFEPQIQDDYPQQLHLTWQDWVEGRIDQFPDPLKKCTGGGSFPIDIYDGMEAQVAQSFQPSFEVLTKVQLGIIRYGDVTYPVKVSIREELNGVNLTSKVLLPDEVPQWECGMHRLTTFDVPNIDVTPGKTYYIICKATQEGGNEPWEDCYLVDLSDTNLYENGTCWISDYWNQNWKCWSSWEVSFATYGLNNGENLPPYVSKRPTGTTSGEKNHDYTYSAKTTDLEGDTLYYKFDWGDDTYTDWLCPPAGASVEATHSWAEDGIYFVSVKAKDIHGAETSWSSGLRVAIGNQPPDRPMQPDGPTEVDARIVPYMYATNTDDPDDDWVYYQWDWGEWTGPWYLFPRYGGFPTIRAHSWLTPGTYEVRVRAATDKDDPSTYSDWSLPLTVTVDDPWWSNNEYNNNELNSSPSSQQNSQVQVRRAPNKVAIPVICSH